MRAAATALRRGSGAEGTARPCRGQHRDSCPQRTIIDCRIAPPREITRGYYRKWRTHTGFSADRSQTAEDDCNTNVLHQQLFDRHVNASPTPISAVTLSSELHCARTRCQHNNAQRSRAHATVQTTTPSVAGTDGQPTSSLQGSRET
jgi:hypothetical protein